MKNAILNFAAIALGAIATVSSSLAQPEERSPEPFAHMRKASDVYLEEVRAGTASAPTVAPLTTGVILWDELRRPPPPVRNSAEHMPVTGEMNTYHK